MVFNPDFHRRKSIRLPNYNYSRPGAYFITICCHKRWHLFGEVVNSRMMLTPVGIAAQSIWHNIPQHFPHVALNEYVIMPNHMHGILIITERRGTACRVQFNDSYQQGTACRFQLNDSHQQGTRCRVQFNDSYQQGTACRAPTGERFGKPIAGSIATIIRSYKSATTQSINRAGNAPGMPIWQRNYWERIIRDEPELQSVRQYIRNNPARWHHDD